MLRPQLQIQLLTAAARRVGAACGGRNQRGSIALLLLVALGVTVGAVAIANSSSNTLLRSAFQGQSREARAVALAGAETIITELNRVENRRLLVTNEPVTAWDNTPSTQANPSLNDKFRNTNCTGGGTKNPTMPTDEAILLTRASVEERIAEPVDGGFRSVAGDNTRQFRLVSIQKLSTKDRNAGDDFKESEIDITAPSTGLIDAKVGYLRLVVQGRILRDNKQISQSTITREFEVVPKCCGQSFGLPVDPDDTTRGAHGMDIRLCDAEDAGTLGPYGVVFGISGGRLDDKGGSGYFLTSKTVNGKDVEVPIDSLVCVLVEGERTDCEGDDFANTKDGPIAKSYTYDDFTQVPDFPSSLAGTITKAQTIDSSITGLRVQAGLVQELKTTGKGNNQTTTWQTASYCGSAPVVVDVRTGTEQTQYHCLINTIDLGNKNLTADTTNGHINFYIRNATVNAISYGGNGELLHVRNGVGPSACNSDANAYVNNLSILGLPSSSNQVLTLKGTSALSGVFVWAPYSGVEIRGGGIGGSAGYNFCGRVWSNDLLLNGNTKFNTPPAAGGSSGGDPSRQDKFFDWVARSVSGVRLF